MWDTLRLACLAVGDSTQANDAMQKELALLESDAGRASQDGLAQALMATLYAREGKADKAEARIQAALSLAPKNPEVLVEVADACGNLHDAARVKHYLQKALDNGADVETIDSDIELKSLNLNFDKDLRKK